MSPDLGTTDLPQISQSVLDAFKQAVSKSEKVLVISHENPDPDAYGSAGGIGQSLKLLGKKVLLANVSENAEDLSFICGVSQTVSVFDKDYQPDLILIVDCGDISRIGDSFRQKLADFSSATVINIDHHISNDSFGKINIIDVAASSTAEIIVYLILTAGLPFDAQSATALFSGILTDSGSFKYSCVRAYTFIAAFQCVQHGANPAEIAKKLFFSTSLSKIRLQAIAMQNMALHCDGKLAFVVVTEDDYKLADADSDDCEGLAEKARGIAGVIVSVMFKHSRRIEDGQEKLIWKISMRSKSDKVDLSALAQQFGGGGHKAAAAFRYRKDLNELQQTLINNLEPVLLSIEQ